MNTSKRKRNDRNDGGGGRGGGGGNMNRPSNRQPQRHNSKNVNNDHHQHNHHHRFGRVMSQPPKLKLHRGASSPCHPTVSIAVPGSVVSNAQTRELQTQLAGQIARAAAVFRIDEIVVFDDGLGGQLTTLSNYRRGPRIKEKKDEESEKRKSEDTHQDDEKPNNNEKEEKSPPYMQPSTDPHAFLARILQYCECPQYLRRKFFPMHPDLQFAGLLPPLDAPHHLRRGDVASFREGVVVDDEVSDGGSFVDCGVPNRLVQIDRVLTPGIRCTVQLDPRAYESRHKTQSNKGFIKGKVVSPTTPRDEDGQYWGYTTRLASSINAIFEECPYVGGYDLKVGTSERGDISIDNPQFCLKKKKVSNKKTKPGGSSDDDGHFNHLLIVFGGVAGIEESVDADESMKLSGENSKNLFDIWVNICPYQGSRTIRTEEAVLIALSRLSPFIAKNGVSESQYKRKNCVEKTEDVMFSDESVSEESSDDE